jgi:hypothetical protein
MTPRRTRTPSDVKWVVNELAAVAGELERIDQALARLQTRRERLTKVHTSLSAVAGRLAIPRAVAVQVVVNAHDRWGGRGNLRQFLRRTLEAAYPCGVSTSSLTDLAIEAFGVQVANAAERKRLIDNSIRSALTKMRGAGEVEPLHSYQGVASYSGVWRLRRQAVTLGGLRGSVDSGEMDAGGGAPVWP